MVLSGSDWSLMNSMLSHFFANLTDSRKFFVPNFTILCQITETLIILEDKPDMKLKEEVEWIAQNTHEKVKEPLDIIERVVFKNLQFGLNKEIEVGNKEYTLAELHHLLHEVSSRLMRIAIKIAKKYSLEIPIDFRATGKTFEFGARKEEGEK